MQITITQLLNNIPPKSYDLENFQYNSIVAPVMVNTDATSINQNFQNINDNFTEQYQRIQNMQYCIGDLDKKLDWCFKVIRKQIQYIEYLRYCSRKSVPTWDFENFDQDPNFDDFKFDIAEYPWWLNNQNLKPDEEVV